MSSDQEYGWAAHGGEGHSYSALPGAQQDQPKVSANAGPGGEIIETHGSIRVLGQADESRQEQSRRTVFPWYATNLDKAIWVAMQNNNSLWRAHNSDERLRNTGKYRTYFAGLEPLSFVYPERGRLERFFKGGQNVFGHTVSKSLFDHTGGNFPTDRDPFDGALVVVVKVDPATTPAQLNARKSEFLGLSRDKGIPVIVQWPGFGARGAGVIYNAGRAPYNDVLIYGGPD